MSMRTNVISLAEFRRAKEPVRVAPLTSEELSYRVDCTAHTHVSPGAVVLLRQIARLTEAGHHELSYTFLCEELRVTKQTLSRWITELEETRFLIVRRAYLGRRFNATNRFEIDFNGPLGAPMPTLRMPKKPKDRGSMKIIPPGEDVKKSYTYNISTKKEKLIPKGISRSAARFDTVAEATAFVERRITRKRADKVAKLQRAGGQLTLAGVKATWATEMLKHYPRVPPVSFSAKEFAVLKMKIQPMLQTCNLSEFFEFIIGSWNSLRASKFIWLRVKGKDVAIAPSLPEVMRYFKVFSQAFADSRMQEANSVAGSVRDEKQVLADQLAAERASKSLLEAERAKLKEKLERVERIAYGREEPPAAKVRSLSARQKALNEEHNNDIDLPTWK